MRCEQGRSRDLATVVVVGVQDGIVVRQKLFKSGAVSIQRDIQHGYTTVGGADELFQQGDIPFDARDQSCFR